MHPNNPALLLKSRAAAVSSGLAIDSLSGVYAAYSTRKLRTAYAGSALRVRDTTTTSEQDIGFDGSGHLDTAALSTFIGGAHKGVVVTWYDQFGANNLTQGTAANAPTIINAGTIKFINSTRPAMDFAGVSWLDNASLNPNPSSTRWISAVLTPNTLVNSAILGPTGTNPALEYRFNSSGNLELLKSFTASIGTSSGALSAGTNAYAEATYDTSGNSAFWINGSASGTGTGGPSLTADTLEVGAQRGGNDPLSAIMGELILVDGSRVSSLQTNQLAYWG